MKFFKLIPLCLMFFSAFSIGDFILAGTEDPKDYKVLSNKEDVLSVNLIKRLLEEGDEFVNDGNLDKAKERYDEARNFSKQLSSFYRDLNGSFRGIDARIPREMDEKGRNSLKIWADANARLVSLYKRKNQPEVAVPLLVEIIRLMSPTSPEGKAAYNSLMEFGFVETPFKGF